ncbi:hypothetical protein BDW62DRAFT_199714 [Aspergillus aurantiobrunneus]
MDPTPELHKHNRTKRGILIDHISKHAGIDRVDSAAWAFLWLADIERLRALAIYSEVNPGSVTRFLNQSEVFRDILELWLTRTRVPEPWKLRPDSDMEYQASMVDHCNLRDSSRCVITTAGEANEIAHIAPFHLGGEKNKAWDSLFWKHLRVFWKPERVRRWFVATRRPEQSTNLMCLCLNGHALMQNARFALRPMRRTADTMEATFWWMPGSVYGERDIRKGPSPIDDKLDGSPLGCKLFDYGTAMVVKSGHHVEFRAAHPSNFPVPSRGVLEMHWYLNRVAALSGVPDLKDDYDRYGNCLDFELDDHADAILDDDSESEHDRENEEEDHADDTDGDGPSEQEESDSDTESLMTEEETVEDRRDEEAQGCDAGYYEGDLIEFD